MNESSSSIPTIKFSQYELRARLLPGVLVILPFAMLCYVVAKESQIIFPSVSALLLFLAPILSENVRLKGLDAQEKLWKKWSGNPACYAVAQILDTKGTDSENYLVKHLETLLDIVFPKSDHKENSQELERMSEYVVTELVRQTKDAKRYPKLFRENMAYGLQRNLYAIRYWGIISNVICSLLLVAYEYLTNSERLRSLNQLWFLVELVYLLFLCFWLFSPTELKVKKNADLYVVRLLEATRDIPLTKNGNN